MESIILQNLLLGPSLTWLPQIIYVCLLLFAATLYLKQKFYPVLRLFGLSWKKLIAGTIIFQIIYASIITWAQYYIWSKNEFTNILLNSPLDKETLSPILQFFFPLFDHRFGYFVFYVLGRFWLEVFIIWMLAALFYFLLRLLNSYRLDFLEPEEILLGLGLALIVGWPNFVIFIPLMCLTAVSASLIRLIIWKEQHTYIAWPMIVAAAVTMFFGAEFLVLLNLTTLKI